MSVASELLTAVTNVVGLTLFCGYLLLGPPGISSSLWYSALCQA